MCCSHHIGMAYMNHYRKCIFVCSNLLNGIKNNGETNTSIKEDLYTTKKDKKPKKNKKKTKKNKKENKDKKN